MNRLAKWIRLVVLTVCFSASVLLLWFSLRWLLFAFKITKASYDGSIVEAPMAHVGVGFIIAALVAVAYWSVDRVGDKMIDGDTK